MILVWNYEVLIWCSATITCFRYFSSAIYRFPIPWFQRVTDTGNSCQCLTLPRTCSVGRFPPRVAFLHVFGVPGAEGVWVVVDILYSIDKIHKRYKDCWDWFILFVLELLFESLFSWESYISRLTNIHYKWNPAATLATVKADPQPMIAAWRLDKDR